MTAPSTYRLIRPLSEESMKNRTCGKCGEMFQSVPLLARHWFGQLCPLFSMDEEVDFIMDRKVEDGVLFYKIHWKGWPSLWDEWIKSSELSNCRKLIIEFESSQTRYDRWRRRAVQKDTE